MNSGTKKGQIHKLHFINTTVVRASQPVLAKVIDTLAVTWGHLVQYDGLFIYVVLLNIIKYRRLRNSATNKSTEQDLDTSTPSDTFCVLYCGYSAFFLTSYNFKVYIRQNIILYNTFHLFSFREWYEKTDVSYVQYKRLEKGSAMKTIWLEKGSEMTISKKNKEMSEKKKKLEMKHAPWSVCKSKKSGVKLFPGEKTLRFHNKKTKVMTREWDRIHKTRCTCVYQVIKCDLRKGEGRNDYEDIL